MATINFYNQTSVLGDKNAPRGYYTGAKTAKELQGAKIVFFTASFTQLKKVKDEAKRKHVWAVSGGLPKELELSWVKRISDISRKHFALIPDYGKIVKPYLKDRNEVAYIEKYMARLEKISPLDVIEDGMILCCYDPAKAFCHRHLIAKWAEDWGKKNGIKIVCAGEYCDKQTIGGFYDVKNSGQMTLFDKEKSTESTQEQKIDQPKTETKEQIVSVDKQFSAIVCEFTEEQIIQYADEIREVAKTIKEKVNGGDSDFTDLVLSFSVEQIQGCADLIVQAAKQFA